MNTAMDAHTKELIAIAPAIAGKCQPCFAHHIKQAQELNIPQEQIDEAIQLAKDIRASGDRHMDEFAQRRIDSTKETIK
jgi:AhpD family alkylhydroperoxidase